MGISLFSSLNLGVLVADPLLSVGREGVDDWDDDIIDGGRGGGRGSSGRGGGASEGSGGISSGGGGGALALLLFNFVAVELSFSSLVDELFSDRLLDVTLNKGTTGFLPFLGGVSGGRGGVFGPTGCCKFLPESLACTLPSLLSFQYWDFSGGLSGGE